LGANDFRLAGLLLVGITIAYAGVLACRRWVVSRAVNDVPGTAR
jgi:hypothetical protein